MIGASADGSESAAFDDAISDLDVALAHWHVNAWGGAEYLVTKLAEVLDVDRIYTTGTPSPDDPNPYGDVEFYDVTQDLSPAPLRRFQTRFGRVFEYALWEDVDWREYGYPDVLVTSGATTRAVITPDDTLHVNYCHSPPRWFYDLYHDRKGSLSGMLARPIVRYLRMRDMTVDPRVDRYFVNSPIIARRLKKFFKRDGEVLYPPLDLDTYHNDGDEGFYLHLGRLDEEKGIEAVVEAFAAGTDRKLVLCGGEGDADDDVRALIDRAANIDYRGFVSQEEKHRLLATCRAVVFNGRNEDFGIVPIEANASGKPVLARNEGFPGLFVEDGENGLLHDGTPRGIVDAVDRLERDGVSGDRRSMVENFSIEAFENQLTETLVERYESFETAIETSDDLRRTR
ncbi:Glycosyltransferase involved in cell wall bisynthesis [Halomicrobium zhouii]|uniref:Glycosyltransferase involved in cell wall bisynthesis n=1 Tax=Halomicrobium zhouii TaxID=767519 RepID=A0A1I6LSX3_9EURY|nr:glycosyltransferase [Halomicrobium zhouii]SFS06524.1 Glycosyltransferase involved in cell wall bisynthesis [Halomicrobium zhouii]